METKIEAPAEITMWERTNLSYSQREIERLKILQRRMFKDSWIKKIVWDKEGGYPEHSWGFVQYTLRPYRQGYGCDGTTDSNIHLIASIMAQREGWNYADLYHRAYEDHEDTVWVKDWLKEIQKENGVIRQETRLPVMNTAKSWAFALNDLYQINNRSLEAVMKELLLDKYPKAEQYLSL